jgi:hypothetical protein
MDRLRGAGLSPRVEMVRGPFWIAILYVAEKTGENLPEKTQ